MWDIERLPTFRITWRGHFNAEASIVPFVPPADPTTATA